MSLVGNNIVIRLLIAVLVYVLVNAAIDTLVKDEPAKQTFKIILLVICLFIAFVGGIFIR